MDINCFPIRVGLHQRSTILCLLYTNHECTAGIDRKVATMGDVTGRLHGIFFNIVDQKLAAASREGEMRLNPKD